MHRYKGIGLIIGIGLLALIVGLDSHLTFKSTTSSKSATSSYTSAAIVPSASLSLITEPDNGITPIVTQINNAQKSIDLVMYQLEDPQIEQALVSAESRGVAVRVLLNQGYYGAQSKDNEAAYTLLQNAHVPVHWTPKYFALTHQKSLVIDNQTADILTFNFTPQYYSTSRDFGVVDSDTHDVAAIESTFVADWDDTKITPPPVGDDLVWSPGSEATMISLINSAKTSLDIYNEEMADAKIVDALEQAAERGVHVEVVMTNSSDWTSSFNKLKSSGVSVRTYAANATLYIHAKMILVDTAQVFLGSENFSTGSLSDNRELGIVLEDKAIIDTLQTTFASDYQAASLY